MYDENAVNRHLCNLGESPTFAINDQCIRLAAQGKKVFKLGLGQSPFPIPPHIVEALARNASERSYEPVQGLLALREAVARFHQYSDGLDVDPSHVMIGPGSKELLFLLQLTFNGEIIIPTPSWVSYAPQARIIGHRIRFARTTFDNRWRLLPVQLSRLIKRSAQPDRPRMLILNSPGNPCGMAYSRQELRALAEVAREHGIIVLSDEIYGHLHHMDNHVSIARFYPEGTIVSSGLSKWCGAGGWRLGTFAFPPQLGWLMKAMVAVASETYSSVCSPVQYAAIEAFTLNEATHEYLMSAQKILRRLGSECAAVLQEAGINVHVPEGGFYLFPDFSKAIRKKRWRIDTSDQLATRLLEDTGVAVISGRAFNRPAKELTARLAYVNFDGAAALSAAQEVPEVVTLPENFTRTYCSDTLEAMERIVDWLR